MNNIEQDALPLPLQLLPDPPITITSEAPPSLPFPLTLPRYQTYGPHSSFMPASYLPSSFGYTAEPMSYDDEDSLSSDPHSSMPLLCTDSDPYRGDLEFKDENEKQEEYDDDPVIYISDQCMYIFLHFINLYISDFLI
ncbi:MAG: hypothetical protein GY755_23360 [Chloroflexi bacterium]|nr:hypothetical protein [Chloroflexota bacterium]